MRDNEVIIADRTDLGLARTTVEYHKHAGIYEYLFISKPNWFELEDVSGNKLTLPPTWYGGSTVHPRRIQEHKNVASTLKEETQRRRHPNSYIKENNLQRDFEYYFDIYVLDLTRLFWCMGMETHTDRHDMQIYKYALEAHIKHNMDKYFIVDGEPVINRFKHVWGNVKEKFYLKYSIEEISNFTDAKSNDFSKLQCFIEELQNKPSTQQIVAEAFVTRTYEEILQGNKVNYKQFRKGLADDFISKHLLLP